MSIKDAISGKIKNMPYKAVASIMKKNYILISKKYKDKKLDSIVEKLNNAIDDRDRNAHRKYVAKLRLRMMTIDDEKKQRGEDFICKFPTCNRRATYVNIDVGKGIHEVFCEKHLKMVKNHLNK